MVFGGAAIESEGELVQVIIQMLLSNRALMSAQQPSLQQRDHTMDTKMLRLCGGGKNLLRTVLWLDSLLTGKNTGKFSNLASRFRWTTPYSHDSKRVPTADA